MKPLALGTMIMGMTMAAGCIELGPGMSHRPALATQSIAAETTLTSAAPPEKPGLSLDRSDPWGEAPKDRPALDTSDPWAEPASAAAPVAAGSK